MAQTTSGVKINTILKGATSQSDEKLQTKNVQMEEQPTNLAFQDDGSSGKQQNTPIFQEPKETEKKEEQPYERHKRPQRNASKPRKTVAPLISKRKIVPVTMGGEDRKRYELEGAMVWYCTIIENKIARGEEVTDDEIRDLDAATDAFEEYIKPGLSFED